MTMEKIKIIIVDDHAIIRDGISAMLKYDDDIQVVAEAANGLDAIIQVEHHGPDVVLMDIIMPEMNGIEALKKMKNKHKKWICEHDFLFFRIIVV